MSFIGEYCRGFQTRRSATTLVGIWKCLGAFLVLTISVAGIWGNVVKN